MIKCQTKKVFYNTTMTRLAALLMSPGDTGQDKRRVTDEGGDPEEAFSASLWEGGGFFKRVVLMA